MRLLLDTDHISILQKQSGPEYRALMPRIAQASPAELAFCIVSFHEQVLGCNTPLLSRCSGWSTPGGCSARAKP